MKSSASLDLQFLLLLLLLGVGIVAGNSAWKERMVFSLGSFSFSSSISPFLVILDVDEELEPLLERSMLCKRL